MEKHKLGPGLWGDELEAEGSTSDQEISDDSRKDGDAGPGVKRVHVRLVTLRLDMVAGEDGVECEGGGNESKEPGGPVDGLHFRAGEAVGDEGKRESQLPDCH